MALVEANGLAAGTAGNLAQVPQPIAVALRGRIYIYVYVYVYVCMYVCMYVCIYVSMQIYIYI